MGEIVNLRRVRKSIKRTQAEAEAEANRAKFGRTKAERQNEAAQQRLLGEKLDGHLLTKREQT